MRKCKHNTDDYGCLSCRMASSVFTDPQSLLFIVVQVGLLVAAMAYNKSTTWMQKRYTALGYQPDADVMATWSTVLSRDSSDDTPEYMTGEDPLCPAPAISVAVMASLDMRMSALGLLTLLRLVLYC